MRNSCSIEGCEEYACGHSFCIKHYTRWVRNGHPLKLRSGSPNEPRKGHTQNGIGYIPLTKGMFALCDPEDLENLSKFNWHFCPQGYATRMEKRKVLRMHRFLLRISGRGKIDHVNGNRLDNRRENIRICNDFQNAQNRRKDRRNTSGYKGVYWAPHVRKWRVNIRAFNRQIFLGYFLDRLEGAKAYDKKAMELFGEFARPNFPCRR